MMIFSPQLKRLIMRQGHAINELDFALPRVKVGTKTLITLICHFNIMAVTAPREKGVLR